ncbi:transcriptional corepressor LEUNIG-like isoform X1 [Rhododendron vialii]|uniref:transcriptional corepressor LEUNIG-like isoform X1 n=1 Tax=Rhododendron vialii TaxID=182163 RepID=UPI002660534A|nr:transcriptional corepressor LEUNIG-like isoform X1 [Rhododendron vialii]
MASRVDWDAEKMLDMYIYDYLVKRNFKAAAEMFARDANVCNNLAVINEPYGFLTEWWTIFWDIYSSRELARPQAMENSTVKLTQMMENEQQNITHTVPNLNQQRAMQFPLNMNFDKMTGQQESSFVASQLPVSYCNPSLQHLNVDILTPSKPSSSHARHCSQFQQQIPHKAQQRTARDRSSGVNLGRAKRMDATLCGKPKPMLPRAGLHDAGLEKGANQMLLKEWPLTGIGQSSPSMSFPVLNSSLPVPNQQQQLHTSIDHHQQYLVSHVIAKPQVKAICAFQGSINNSGNMLPTNVISGTDRQDGKGTEVEKSSDVDMESLLSHDVDNADNTGTSFSNFPTTTTPCSIKNQNGFQFEEVASVNSSNGEILCCHFSTDGHFVASAGHGRKVLLWRTSTFDFVNTAEGHSHLITDVRFRPNSSTFATSSFDKTVQIWDAKKPTDPLFRLFGHTEQVTSLDFHPRKTDVLCSCDSNDEIRLWSIKQCACTSIFKGATRQVRFQPRLGKLLAAASGNKIGLFDVETNILQCYLEGHVKEVRSICWDSSGRYIASVSEESARVWSFASGGNCVYELHSNGNKFESCTFHPGYSLLMVIGCYKSIKLWNPTDKSSKPVTVATAHNGIISALADCPQNQMIASVSHDRCMKLWR